MLKITKKGTRNFWHFDGLREMDFSTWEITLNETEQNVILIQENGAPFPKKAILIGQVIVVDETDASAEETFTTTALLRARLIELGYNALVEAGGGGGGIPDAPNNSNAYVRSALNWVIGYTKTAIDTLLNNKVDKVSGSRLITSSESIILGNTSGTNTGDQDLSGLQPLLTFDTTPISLSTNPVTSDGVFDALALKKDTATIQCMHGSQNLADSTSYFFGLDMGFAPSTTTNASRRFTSPLSGKIIAIRIITISTTATSSQDVVFKINNKTSSATHTIGNIRYDNITTSVLFSGLSIDVAQLDDMECQVDVPILTTNGTGSRTSVTIFFEKV